MKEILSKEEILEIINQCSPIVGSHILDKQKLAEQLFEKIAQQHQPAGLRWVKESLEFANKLKQVCEGTQNWNGQSDCERLIELLESLSASSEWIAVETGFPETEGRYMVCLKYGQGRQEIKISFFRKDHNCFDDFLENIITHWQPLPAPPIPSK